MNEIRRSMTNTPSLYRRVLLLGALALAATLPIAGALILDAEYRATGHAWDSYGLFLLTIGILGITAASVGVVILWHTSGNVIGAMLLAGSLVLMSSFLAWPTASYRGATFSPNDIIGGLALWWSSNSLLVGIFLFFPGVGILFPDGQLPGPRWRVPFIGVIVLFGVSALLQTIAQWPRTLSRLDDPFAIPGVPVEVNGLGAAIGGLALVVSIGLATIAVTMRFRRSVGVERAQMKWLVASIAVMTVVFPISFGTDIGPAGLVDVASGIAGCLIPIAVGIAVLRYRLYDIDRIISRTIAYAVVSGILAAVFGGVILLLQAVLERFTQGQTIAVAASTLAAFTLFQPLLRRVGRAVDRRFDRARYDADRTVAAFSERLQGEVDMATVTADLARTTESALAPSTLRIWLRASGAGR